MEGESRKRAQLGTRRSETTSPYGHPTGLCNGETDEQFGMAATAHVTVFSLGLVSASLGGRGFDGGWKEI
jgi:hypothetical protein